LTKEREGEREGRTHAWVMAFGVCELHKVKAEDGAVSGQEGGREGGRDGGKKGH